MKKIYFVRHGEAEGNVTRIAQDEHTPLTENSHNQAKVVADRVSKLTIEKVYVSSMVRALDTGTYIVDKLGLSSVSSPLFREWTTPESVRGKRHDSEEYSKWFKALSKNYHDVDWHYEDAENFSDLLKRVEEATTLLEEDKTNSILVVSHGKFLRLLLAYVLTGKNLTPETHLQIAQATKVSNTGITVFEVEDCIWTLITWNDHAHFADN